MLKNRLGASRDPNPGFQFTRQKPSRSGGQPSCLSSTPQAMLRYHPRTCISSTITVSITATIMLDYDVRLAFKTAKTPPILRLPPSVRQRIYLHVGLIPTDVSALQCVLDLHGHNQSLDLGFHGLLVSCRTIYTEASVILYSANRFNIRYWDKRSLEPLRNMTPRTLSNLTYLKIILNETACHERDESEAYDAYCATLAHKDIAAQGEGQDFLAGHNPPLRGHQALAGTLPTEWASTAAHLSSGIAAKQLELCVVCDVDEKDINTAKRVVEPLFRLPLLKDCHLRLSRKSTPELNSIARHAALKLRGLCWPQEVAASQPYQEPSEQSCHRAYPGSRLLDLPRELRFRILEYTDLITPWKEVTWSRKHHAFLGVKAFCAPLDHRGKECPPHVHHGCQFVDCWQNLAWPLHWVLLPRQPLRVFVQLQVLGTAPGPVPRMPCSVRRRAGGLLLG